MLMKIKCPKCSNVMVTTCEPLNSKEFILATCINCKSNIACFGKNIVIISDKLRNKIIQGQVPAPGLVPVSVPPKAKSRKRKAISIDDICALHKLLEKYKDSEEFIRNI